MKRSLYMISLHLVLVLLSSSIAQKVQWKRSEAPVSHLQLFHSTHVINLPTSETHQQGDFEFEISHRFVPAIEEGYKSFWGLDGPANIRLAFAYAPTDEMILTLGRTNVNNNLDLQVRYQLLSIESDLLPLLGSANLGAAWNSYIGDRPNGDSRNFQYYAQFAVNTLLFDKLGLGVVPSYLYNSAILYEDIKKSVTMGTYIQYYFSPLWSLLLE